MEATEFRYMAQWSMDTLPMLECVEILVSTYSLEAEESLFKFRNGAMVERLPPLPDISSSRETFVRQ